MFFFQCVIYNLLCFFAFLRRTVLSHTYVPPEYSVGRELSTLRLQNRLGQYAYLTLGIVNNKMVV